MLRAISALVLIGQVLFPTASPGVDKLDANARAAGNRKVLAISVGRSVFKTEWPAQVTNVYADGVGAHDVVGLRLSGVHFHHALTRAEFAGEISRLAARAFAVSPWIEEVDIWASVPLRVGKDVVVAGDLAVPTSRNVFTVTIRRGESESSLVKRVLDGQGTYLDQEWAAAALK